MKPAKPTPEAVELLLAEPVDLRRLVDQLQFAEEDIARATREQARMFLEASRYRVLKLRNRLRAEAVFKSEYAQVSLRLRREKRAAKERKEKGAPTESAIRDQAAQAPTVVQAQRALDVATVHEEWSKLLVEAYRQRRDACRILAEIMGAEASAELRIAHGETAARGLQKLRREVASRWPGKEEAEDTE